MSANPAIQPEPAPLDAVTISRDVQEFDLLIEDMEAELGEAWGDLTFAEATEFLRQDEAAQMSFVVVAADHSDEAELPRITNVIRLAKRAGLQVILVADGLGPMVLHELLRAGADDFAPYPLPERALADAVARVRSPKAGVSEAMRDAKAMAAGAEPATDAPVATTGGRAGGARVFAFQSVVGGAGATTMAVNLAAELAVARKDAAICVMDLGLQFGSVASYLDLSRPDNIYDILTDTSAMDEQAFRQSLQTTPDGLHVFTSPAELLPLDLIGPDDVKALIGLARKCFDYVIIDAPTALTQWTDTLIAECDRFHMITTMEVRAAQSAMRLLRLLKTEAIPMDTMAWLINKAPRKGDMASKGRADKLAEMLGVRFDAVMSDGGQPVTDANDAAIRLSEAMARAPLRKELANLAERLAAAGEAMDAGLAPKKAKKPIFGIKFG